MSRVNVLGSGHERRVLITLIKGHAVLHEQIVSEFNGVLWVTYHHLMRRNVAVRKVLTIYIWHGQNIGSIHMSQRHVLSELIVLLLRHRLIEWVDSGSRSASVCINLVALLRMVHWNEFLHGFHCLRRRSDLMRLTVIMVFRYFFGLFV